MKTASATIGRMPTTRLTGISSPVSRSLCSADSSSVVVWNRCPGSGWRQRMISASNASGTSGRMERSGGGASTIRACSSATAPSLPERRRPSTRS